MEHRGNEAEATRTATRGRPQLVLAVAADERAAFFPPETRAALDDLARVRAVEPAELHPVEDFAAIMRDADVLVTAWGVPRLDADRLASAPRLRLVAHAASSVRFLVGEAFWSSAASISQAGAAMGPAVAELSLTATLSLLRRTHRMDHALRTGGDWDAARAIPRAREISGARIGVVGASRTGRAYLASCQALGARVAVFDPYLPEADPLNSVSQDLATLLSTSDVVAIHAPATPETVGLIGAEHVAGLRVGCLVVNTARSSIVDNDALYAAAATGRIDVALDVFDQEPLPRDDRWRSLPNVLLTGHRGGATVESRQRAGRIVVDEVRRHLTGEPLLHSVTRADVERMG